MPNFTIRGSSQYASPHCVASSIVVSTGLCGHDVLFIYPIEVPVSTKFLSGNYSASLIRIRDY